MMKHFLLTLYLKKITQALFVYCSSTMILEGKSGKNVFALVRFSTIHSFLGGSDINIKTDIVFP